MEALKGLLIIIKSRRSSSPLSPYICPKHRHTYTHAHTHTVWLVYKSMQFCLGIEVVIDYAYIWVYTGEDEGLFLPVLSVAVSSR